MKLATLYAPIYPNRERYVMHIPSTFKLLGTTYTVALIPAADWKHGECAGICDSDALRIEVLADAPREAIEHTALHEMTHAILRAMGRDKLDGDEVFVDLFAGLLHQALTTAEPRTPLDAPRP